jgi:hypothetical protein
MGVEQSIEVGDKMRIAIGLIATLQRKGQGATLLVEVVDITEQADGTKLMTVKAAQ